MNPREQLRSSAWQDVDDSGAPEEFIKYLDQLEEATRATRLESAVLLGLTTGSRVIDVGCGTGATVVEFAAKVGSSGRAVGVDSSDAMIATARVRADAAGAPCELVIGDARRLDAPAASFDAVHCDRVLQHLDDPEAAIAEMARVLVPGGRLLIREPDWDGLFIDADDDATTRAVRDALVGNIRQPRIGRALRRLALAAELEVIDFGGGFGVYAVSLAAAEAVWGLRGHLDAAVSSGTVDADAANVWWQYLTDVDTAGRFFAGVVGFRLVARKAG